MAILGSSIDPRLQLQDYSGFVNTAQMQAQGLAGLGQQISQAADQYKQYKKEQQEAEKRVKAAEVSSSAIAQLVPDLKGPLGIAIEKLRDPNIPLYERDAVAQSIGDVLKLGIAQVNSNALMALQRDQFNLQKQAQVDEQAIRRAKAEADKAAAQADNQAKLNEASAAISGIQQAFTQAGQSVDPKVVNNISKLIQAGQGDSAVAATKAYIDQASKVIDLNKPINARWTDPETGMVNEGLVQFNSQAGGYSPLNISLMPPSDVIPPEDQAAPSTGPAELQQSTNIELGPDGMPIPSENAIPAAPALLPPRSPVIVPSVAQAKSESDRPSARQETLDMIKQARRLAESGDTVGAADILNALRFASPFIGGPVTPDNVENVFDLTDNAIAKSASGAEEQPVKFPLQVRKGNQVATVSNPQELESAKSKGFKPEQ